MEEAANALLLVGFVIGMILLAISMHMVNKNK